MWRLRVRRSTRRLYCSTSDLDDDTETEIIAPLEELHRAKAFGFLLVTHNLQLPGIRSGSTKCGRPHSRRSICRMPLASRSRRNDISCPPVPIACAGSRPLMECPDPPVSAPIVAYRPDIADKRGGDFRGILLINFAVAQYQELRVRERGARLAKLAELELTNLQEEVQSVSDLGDGRYELAVLT